MSAPRKPRHRISSIAGALLWIAASGVVGLLLFSYLLPQDLSRTTPAYSRLVQISFFGRVLTFHLSLLLVVIGVLALPPRRWRLVVAAGCAGLIASTPTLHSLLPHHPPGASGPALRIMSMNLKYTSAHAELITDQVRQMNPDMLVLQDCTPFSKSALERSFGSGYPFRYVQMNTLQGLGIYSRRPFVGGRPRTTFSSTRRQMRAVIDLNGQPIVIYIAHPYSPRTQQRIVNNRLATIDLIAQIQAEQSPVIVAGDFNFTDTTPNEYALKVAGFHDTFDLAGHGRGSTWPVQPRWLAWLPGFRIDHFVIGRQLTCTRFFVGEFDGSDHLPIVADVAMSRLR